MWFNFARLMRAGLPRLAIPSRGRWLAGAALAALLGHPGTGRASVKHDTDEEVPRPPVRGSGRLVKQVAATPHKKTGKTESPRQGRVAVTVPALLARSHPAWENRKSLLPEIEMQHITSH